MNKNKRIEATINVRSLCRMKDDDRSGWINFITDIGSELFHKMDTDANVRERRVNGKDFRELCNVIAIEEKYLKYSTPISGFAESEMLALHPDNNEWVELLKLDDNTLARVSKIRLVYNCFDGQHRGGAFQNALDELRKLMTDGEQKRETRVVVLYGVPEDAREERAKTAGGHNTISHKVDKSTVMNAMGNYQPIVIALGDYAGSVEWKQNASIEDDSMIYAPHTILQMILALDFTVFTSKVQTKVTDWTKNAERYLPWFSELRTILEAYEIIRYESETVFQSKFGTSELWEDAKVKQMFGNRAAQKPRREYVQTATLGDVTVYPLHASFSLLILHSLRSFFGKEDGKVRLLTSREEFLAFVREILPNHLEKIAHRKVGQPSAYIRELRKVGKKKVGAAGYGLSRDVTEAWNRYQETVDSGTRGISPAFVQPSPPMTM
jgi:hypothetical protein